EDLLNGEANIYEDSIVFVVPYPHQSTVDGHRAATLCNGWVSKQWKSIKKFAKKHKKSLIIGTAIAVAAAIVVVTVAAAVSSATAGAAVGAAGAVAGTDKHKSTPVDVPSEIVTTNEAPILKTTIDSEKASFKEYIVENQLLSSKNPAEEQCLPLE